MSVKIKEDEDDWRGLYAKFSGVFQEHLERGGDSHELSGPVQSKEAFNYVEV